MNICADPNCKNPDCPGHKDLEVVAHIKKVGKREREKQALIDWIQEQGGDYGQALEMLQNRNKALGEAWARGYAEGLRTP